MLLQQAQRSEGLGTARGFRSVRKFASSEGVFGDSSRGVRGLRGIRSSSSMIMGLRYQPLETDRTMRQGEEGDAGSTLIRGDDSIFSRGDHASRETKARFSVLSLV